MRAQTFTKGRGPGFFLKAILAGLIFVGMTAEPGEAQLPIDDQLIMTLEAGEVVIGLRPDLAPRHAERLVRLANDGFYDDVVFHRVIDGFMAQTGDPTGTGTGSSTLPDLAAEFSSEPFRRGTVGMARSSSPDSANSQFFIMFDRGDWLDGQYTVVGRVRSGMELIDQLARGEPPETPDRIVTMRSSISNR